MNTIFSDPFWLKALFSVVVGGGWITIATILAEKYGSKLGGVIAGLPSTSFIAYLFLSWTEGIAFTAEATKIAPYSLGVTTLFIVVYVALLRRFHFWIALWGSLLFWFLGILGISLLPYGNILVGTCFFIISFGLACYFLERVFHIPSHGQKNLEYTSRDILLRAGVGGGIIFFALVLAKYSGAFWGGAFALFPALMTATMIITYYDHGKEFSAAILKVIAYSGSSTVLIYSLGVGYFYPLCGVFYGTVLSFILSLITGYLVYSFIKRNPN